MRFLNTLFHKFFVFLRSFLEKNRKNKYCMSRSLLKKLTNQRLGALLLLSQLTATTAWADLEPVKYIDADGIEKDCEDYTVLTGDETSLAAGTYVVNSNITYTSTVNLTGNVTLILADGCTMNVGTSDGRIHGEGINGFGTNNCTLDIYGQANGTGVLSIYTGGSSSKGIFVKGLTINGGNVTANDSGGSSGAIISALSKVTINGGTVNAISSGCYGISAGGVIINGGTVNANGGDGKEGICANSGNGTITLGWNKPADRICITANGYSGTVKVAESKYLYNGTELLGGTITDLTKLAGKTLVPAYKVSIAEDIKNGTTVANKEFVIADAEDKTVTLTITPAANYCLGTVKYNDGSEDHVISPNEGVYSFSMPASNVTVSATFTPDIATHWQADADHDGSTAEKAYIITTPAGLNLLASEVNSGNSYKNKYFMLGDDITYTHTTDWNDATSTENNYTAIGNNKKYFEGYFDGNGKTVRGIRIYKSGETLGDDNSLGLFGYFLNSGEIKNVILADARITGCASVGGIVGGSNGSPITNCHVLDDVAIHAVKYDAQAHGGIAGATGGNITGCTSAASITTNTGAGECQYFGGIVGYNCGTVSNCLYLGSTINGKMSVGAIVGKNESNGTLQNSYYTSTNISGKNNSGNQLDYTVSAVGHNAGTVTNSGLAYSITLDKDLSIAGDQTVYDVSGLTAYGNTALSYNNGTTTTIYTCKGVTVPLSYGGTVPEDYTFGGYAVKDADNNVVDVSESGGVYSFTMPNKNVNVSTKITRNTTINVEVGNANYMVAGHDAYVVVTMTPDDFNGIATISVTPEGGDSKPYNVAVVNGEGRYVVNNLASSSYTVQASFAGDDNYTASTSVVKQLVVGKIPTTLTISVDRTTFIVGEPITISVVMNEMINAVVTVKVNGENYTLGLVCGKGSITFSHLDVGTYKIDAVYAGDDIYNSYETTLNNKSISVEVKKNNTNIGVEVASPVIAKEVNE